MSDLFLKQYERKTEKAANKWQSLKLAAAALVIVLILWNVEIFDPLLYPFRLFVTYIHEAAHGLMALITGGRIVGFTVSANGSGLATTAGGWRALILPAGYLGAAFFGALLFYLTNRIRYPRILGFGLGIFLIGFSVLFARPDQSGLPIALMVGVVFGLILIALAWKARISINILVLNILAMLSALNAVLDVVFLTQNTGAAAGVVRNDAAAFSAEVLPFMPPVVWAVLWAAIALSMLLAAVYFGVIHPLRDVE